MAYQAANGTKSPEDVQKATASFLGTYLGSGDYANAKQQIWNNAMGALSGTQRDKVISASDGIETLKEINSLMKDYYADGGSTDMFTGSIEDVMRDLGTSQDSRLVQISSLMQTAVDYRSRQQSGAALSETEVAFYNALYPAITNLSGVNDTLLETQLGTFYREQRNRIGGVIGVDYYDKFFGADTLSQERGWNDEDATNTQNALYNILTIK